MTMQRLQKAVDMAGVAKAVVFLNREHVSDSPDATKIELRLDPDGRMTRIAPAVKQDVIAALAQHFVSPQNLQATPWGADVAGQARQMVHFPFLEAVHGVVDQKGLDNLVAHDATHSLHHAPELSVIQPVTTNDADAPPSGPTWGLNIIKALDLWERGYTGKNVVVAHLDSGADSQHVALQNAIEKYAKFDVSGHPVDAPAPYKDSDNHGTHTAGTIAGRTVDGAPVVGIAPDVELVDATIVGKDNSVSRVLAGMNWSLEKGARVLSLSVGFLGWDDSFEAVIKKLRSQQLLPVVAIGNDGQGASRSPGNYSTVLSVGASNERGFVAGFSSSTKSGQKASGPAICAPGVDILSAKPGGGYRESSGTSMSAPHVAGLAAILFSAKPDATIDQVEQAIVKSCSNPQNESAVRIGAGIPDGVAALNHLLQR